jgi:hypothetical protein
MNVACAEYATVIAASVTRGDVLLAGRTHVAARSRRRLGRRDCVVHDAVAAIRMIVGRPLMITSSE